MLNCPAPESRAKHRRLAACITSLTRPTDPPVTASRSRSNGAAIRVPERRYTRCPVGTKRASAPPSMSTRRSPVFRDWMATSVWSQMGKLARVTVNTTASPPGSTNGSRWLTSPFDASSSVSGSGLPPEADTRMRPARNRPNTITSFDPQLTPYGSEGVSAMTLAGPPASATFRREPRDQKPTHSPSGDRNGLMASSVPAIGVASS